MNPNPIGSEVLKWTSPRPLHWLLALVFGLLLGGCTSLSPSFKGTDESVLVGTPLPQSWSLSGRIGVLNEGEGWHGKMDWQQNQADFVIRILGPFGSEQAELHHRDAKLELRGANGKTVSGARLAAWEKETFGASLPVNALPYWLHGLPYPGEPENSQLDAKGQIKQIQQSGWRVDYSEWRKQGDTDIPGKITLLKNKVRIRLIVNEYSKRV
ncbi:MAG: outer membrane lipoprotein LolB [Gammaproteobacteria bacterium]|nr:outer membrane lipoprotein LolB [Gammaproteobacteria bacterium]